MSIFENPVDAQQTLSHVKFHAEPFSPIQLNGKHPGGINLNVKSPFFFFYVTKKEHGCGQ
jgi:hypothetical protein